MPLEGLRKIQFTKCLASVSYMDRVRVLQNPPAFEPPITNAIPRLSLPTHVPYSYPKSSICSRPIRHSLGSRRRTNATHIRLEPSLSTRLNRRSNVRTLARQKPYRTRPCIFVRQHQSQYTVQICRRDCRQRC